MSLLILEPRANLSRFVRDIISGSKIYIPYSAATKSKGPILNFPYHLLSELWFSFSTVFHSKSFVMKGPLPCLEPNALKTPTLRTLNGFFS